MTIYVTIYVLVIRQSENCRVSKLSFIEAITWSESYYGHICAGAFVIPYKLSRNGETVDSGICQRALLRTTHELA